VTHEDVAMNPEKEKWLEGERAVSVSNTENRGIEALKKRLISFRDKLEFEITPLQGLVTEGDLILLVIPIDLAAPKGRLIQPQVETIRDALDRDCGVLMCKERELSRFYEQLPEKPKLVITDSQAFHKVAADIPADQALTSFSILFARKKGDLGELVRGLEEMEKIGAGGKVLVMEACSHHRQADDIGTVKIPRLFRQLVEPDILFDFTRKIPDEEELQSYEMVIHCAGCMLNRASMMDRLKKIKTLGLSVTNYGLFLGWVNGLIPRALQPLPEYAELTASLTV
jgi:[FeFe] hydrogenase H-cluster maturation GTPase HydF